MSDTLTEGAVVEPASNEPTGQEASAQPAAESQNQEAISSEPNKSQEDAANDTASQKQTQQNGSESIAADDALVKFAKSQGMDYATATENEKRLIKIASDNQKAFRQSSQPKIEDAAKELSAPGADASEVAKLASKVQAFEYKTLTDNFWSQEGRDRALEGKMVSVLNDKRDKFGKEYAFALSQDLDTLYAMAQLDTGAIDVNAAKEEGRREERESIRQATNAGAPQSHAVSQAQGSEKIDRQWIKDTYQPGNPEHEALFQEALARGDLY